MKVDRDVAIALSSIPWFQELNHSQIRTLARIGQIRSVGVNEYLFHEGDREDYLYVLLEGSVSIEVDFTGREHYPLYRAEPSDFIGWSSVTPVIRQRTASARAVVPCRLIAIDSIKLSQLCDDDPRLGYIIMRRLAYGIATRLLTTRLELVRILSNPR